MPYVQNTDADVAKMLKAIGKPTIDALFECLPEAIRLKEPLRIPAGLSELELARHIEALAANQRPQLAFANLFAELARDA